MLLLTCQKLPSNQWVVFGISSDSATCIIAFIKVCKLQLHGPEKLGQSTGNARTPFFAEPAVPAVRPPWFWE